MATFSQGTNSNSFGTFLSCVYGYAGIGSLAQLIPRFSAHPNWLNSPIVGGRGSLKKLRCEQLPLWTPINGWRYYPAMPAHSLQHPQSAQFSCASSGIIVTEFGATTGADLISDSRPWQSAIAAYWACVHLKPSLPF